MAPIFGDLSQIEKTYEIKPSLSNLNFCLDLAQHTVSYYWRRKKLRLIYGLLESSFSLLLLLKPNIYVRGSINRYIHTFLIFLTVHKFWIEKKIAIVYENRFTFCQPTFKFFKKISHFFNQVGFLQSFLTTSFVKYSWLCYTAYFLGQ